MAATLTLSDDQLEFAVAAVGAALQREIAAEDGSLTISSERRRWYVGGLTLLHLAKPAYAQHLNKLLSDKTGLDVLNPAVSPTLNRAAETLIRNLTVDQVRVVTELLAEPYPQAVTVSGRTVRFLLPPADAVDLVIAELDKLSGRGYPRRPMASVLRKVSAEAATAIAAGLA